MCGPHVAVLIQPKHHDHISPGYVGRIYKCINTRDDGDSMIAHTIHTVVRTDWLPSGMTSERRCMYPALS